MNDQQFTPDLVYNLISNSPQGRVFVENLAKMNQLQQAAKQFAPQLQQFSQNPMQAMQNIGEWAQTAVNQMNGQQTLPQQQYQQVPAPAVVNAPQEGGSPMQQNGGMMGMAMDIVNKFENTLKEMNETLKTINESNIALSEKVSSLATDMSSVKDDLGKLL